MEQDDTALVMACRRGDQAAWDALVGRYERLVYAVARRAGMGVDEAADVYQRVFAILIEHLDSIEQPDQLGAWLISTTRREVWRIRRRERSAARFYADADDALTVPDETPQPDQIMELVEERARVRAAVAQLDERCRQLIGLLFSDADALAYAEIATLLGISEGSIGPTRARCLDKLRRLLETPAT
jgi:RNA polymerase sigma factor (sigma-70 family)